MDVPKIKEKKIMAKLTPNDFMKAVQGILKDRTDDEALKFLEDCKDTITSEHEDYKEKYEAVLKEKEELDKSWREKYTTRFYSDDTNINNNKDNQDNTNKDPNFDTRSEELKKAESITIDDLFKPAE